MSGTNRNSSRPGSCNAAALSISEDVLIPTILTGDRATRRLALRNLQKLIKSRKIQPLTPNRRLAKRGQSDCELWPASHPCG